MFEKIEDAKAWVETRHRFSKKMNLDQMVKALALLGNPENSYLSLHVGGTNGKGSTCNYLKNILCTNKNLKVGLYTSPYVVRFNERIMVNDEFVSDEDLLKYLNYLYDFNDKFQDSGHDPLTFFEIVTIMAFMYFKDQKCDIVVFEVGLGGVLDATNVINPVVSVITNVGYDHMNILGDTLVSIADNKLGIVKQNGVLITSENNQELDEIINKHISEKNARLIRIGFSKISNVEVTENSTEFSYYNQHYSLSLIGFHQVYNAVLAIEVIKYLNKLSLKQIGKYSNEDIFNGLKITKWPGRFEVFPHNLILDGAHNLPGIEALKETMMTYKQDKIVKCLFCAMKDKDLTKMMPVLDSFIDEVVFTEIDYQRSSKAQDLISLSKCLKKGYEPNFEKALKRMLKSQKENEIVLITGSLYFISNIRKLIVNK